MHLPFHFKEGECLGYGHVYLDLEAEFPLLLPDWRSLRISARLGGISIVRRYLTGWETDYLSFGSVSSSLVIR